MRSKTSLAINIATLFAVSIVLVLLVAGKIVTDFTYKHFNELDQDELSGKAISAQSIIESTKTNEAKVLLDALIVNHNDLGLYVLDEQSTILYQNGKPYPLPELTIFKSDAEIVNWSVGDKDFRGLKVSRIYKDKGVIDAVIVMDANKHQLFFAELSHFLFMIFAIMLISLSLMGYFVAWRGLMPVRALGRAASNIDVNSLSTRLTEDNLHVELQPLVKALNDMLSRLESSFNKLSFFSTNLAHEMRTPLSSMVLQNQIMLTGKRTLDDYRGTLASNLEELEFLSNTVTDMLLVAKAESNQLAMTIEEIDLKLLAEKVCDYYQLLADEKGVHIEVVGNAKLYSDSGLIRRILGNLLSNATRHADDKSIIKISLEDHGQNILIAIMNQGETISLTEQSMIFERKYQAKHSDKVKSREVHVGVGLTIIRSIIRAMNGDIYLESRDRKTTFFVELPKVIGK